MDEGEISCRYACRCLEKKRQCRNRLQKGKMAALQKARETIVQVLYEFSTELDADERGGEGVARMIRFAPPHSRTILGWRKKTPMQFIVGWQRKNGSAAEKNCSNAEMKNGTDAAMHCRNQKMAAMRS